MNLNKKICVIILLVLGAFFTLTIRTEAQTCPSISRPLSQGLSGDDVRSLQKFLSEVNLFDSENITGYFGPITEKSVQKFQEKNNVVKTGNPSTTGYGLVGRLTQAAIKNVCIGDVSYDSDRSETSTASANSNVSSFFVSPLVLKLGTSGTDVNTLQSFLKEEGFFKYPVITGYFGPITQTALKNFQSAHGIDPVGFMGPQTRAKVLEISNFYQPSSKFRISGIIPIFQGIVHRDTDSQDSPVESTDPIIDVEISSIASSPATTTATITWTTNVASDSTVDYGETTSYGTASTSSTLTTSHSITLTNLTAGTLYNYRIQSTSADASVATSNNITFTTIDNVEISSIASSPATTTATITWTTNVASDSTVDYGETTSYGTASTSSTLTTSHSITLTNLTAGTLYNYRIQSTSADASVATSSNGTFTTPAYDSDALALFTRMSSSPTNARKELINSLILSLKAANVWTKLDTLYVIAAHDSQAALLNWKGSSFNMTAVSSPVFSTDRGYYTNGSSSYLNWSWAPTNGVNYSQNSATFGIWTRNSSQYSSSPAGTGTTTYIAMNPRATTDKLAYRINSSTAVATTITDGSGLSAVTRSASNVTQAYKNGSVFGSAGSGSSSGLSTSYVNLGRAASVFVATQFSAAFIGSSLSSQEHTDLYNSLNTYMTALGVDTVTTSATLSMSTATTLPDGGSNSDSGKGWTNTGLTYDSSEGVWWVGNHGKALPASSTYAPSVVKVSSDFSTILDEILVSTVATTTLGSVQGVAYDTTDDTLWVVHKNPSVDARIYHLTKAGSLLASFTMPEGTNGLAYDSLRDELVVSNDSGVIEWRSKTTLALTGSISSLNLTSVDQISYDATTDTLLATKAGTGSNSLVYIYKLTGVSDYDGSTAPYVKEIVTLTGADQIEGVVFRNNTFYIMNDGYYHSGSPALNRAIVYPN